MQYRDVEYSLVRTIDKGWRWSVKHAKANGSALRSVVI